MGVTPVDFTIAHVTDEKGYWEAEVFGFGVYWHFNRKHGSWQDSRGDALRVVAEELQAEVHRIEKERKRKGEAAKL